MIPRLVHGEPSFHLSTQEVTLNITVRGGQLAPVVFHLPGRDVSPYSLSPWEPAEFPEIPPLLSVLRGDFFCFPFGAEADWLPHGETANNDWQLVDANSRSLKLVIDTADTDARVEKTIAIRPGEHAVYVSHTISGAEGDFSYGSHPIINLSDLPEGAGRVSTSAFQWASVYPGVFANPAQGERQALKAGALFTDLHEVELAAGGTTDLTRYPSRAGFEDLVMMVAAPATEAQPFAWSAVLLDGYVWFSLKNPAEFPSTILWISNAGRSAPPWNDRHTARLGIEEVCSHFADGLETSRLDLLKKQGVVTARKFRKDEPVTLRNIQGVAAVPAGFGEVRAILPAGSNAVRITGSDDTEIIVEIDWTFVA